MFNRKERIINLLVENNLISIFNTGIVLTSSIRECNLIGISKEMLEEVGLI